MPTRAGRVYVCEECVEDEELQEVVRDNAISEDCDYCDRKAALPIACELSDVIERMQFAIDQEFTDPANELPWDGREGGYQGMVLDSGYDLFPEVGFEIENQVLMDDLLHAFMEPYCWRDYFGPNQYEYFQSVWQRFATVVKHERPYTFWLSRNVGAPGQITHGITPAEILRGIGQCVEIANPVLIMPVGTEIWRVRTHDEEATLRIPHSFTSPPLDRAVQPNRMSPMGVPMFYGADDFHAACLEVLDGNRTDGTVATGVKFATLVPLTILDLSRLQEPRSFFVPWDRRRRQSAEFLEAFADELSKPIKRDRQQHIEYVPTQAFTEYVRYELKTSNASKFNGIKYRSSQLPGRSCYVIFANQSDCLPGSSSRSRPQLLGYLRGSRCTVRLT